MSESGDERMRASVSNMFHKMSEATIGRYYQDKGKIRNSKRPCKIVFIIAKNDKIAMISPRTWAPPSWI